MKKIFMIAFLGSAAMAAFAENCTVIHYHQPGLIEAVGRTAIGLTAAVGSTAVGLTAAAGSTAVGLTHAIGRTAVGLVAGSDQTIVIPHQPQVIYQRPAAPVYYAPPAVGTGGTRIIAGPYGGTRIIAGPGYGGYGAYAPAPVMYTAAPAVQYRNGIY